MNPSLIFIPVLVQVSLVLWLYISLSGAKKKAVASGQVDEKRRDLFDDAWPAEVIKINNNIKNQFQAPVLFYVIIFILWSINTINLLVHIVAWLFVLSRLIHSHVHTGSNFVPNRRKAFVFGVLLLIVLTFYTIYSLLASY